MGPAARPKGVTERLGPRGLERSERCDARHSLPRMSRATLHILVHAVCCAKIKTADACDKVPTGKDESGHFFDAASTDTDSSGR